MFRGLAEGGPPLQDMVEAANRSFCRSTPEAHFATLIVGCADRHGLVEFVSAGHLPLLHIRDNVIRTEDATGVPLGIVAHACFPSRRLFLDQGETLLIYTDRDTEAHNTADEEYGIDRLKMVAAQHCRAAPADLLDECLMDVRIFSAGTKRTDDITLMSILRRS